jgi:hypothetical protein
MKLSPEQFNIIATKDDLNNLEEKIDLKITQKMDRILNAVDGLAKSVNDMKAEFASNMAAHDRFETRITRVEKQLELDPIID